MQRTNGDEKRGIDGDWNNNADRILIKVVDFMNILPAGQMQTDHIPIIMHFCV